MAEDLTKETAKSAPGSTTASKKAGKTTKTSAASSKTAKAAAQPAVSTNKSEGLGLPQQVDLMWTVAIAVVAFVLGFFVNSLFASPQPGTTIPPVNSISSSPAVGNGGTGGAPTLTEDQLQSELPQGHPSVGDPSGAPGTGQANPADGFTNPEALQKESGMGDKKSDVPASGELAPDGQSVAVPEGLDPNNKK